jgi:AcrR family transcriptional regulator
LTGKGLDATSPKRAKTPRVRTSATKRSKVSRAEKAELSTLRLFQLATEIIGKRGTRDFSLREVSKKAGYSSALAGMKFGTKEEFLLCLMREGGNRWAARTRQKLMTDGGQKLSGLQALDAGLAGFEDWCGNRKDALAQTLIFFELVSGREAARTVVAENHQGDRDLLRELIQQTIAETGRTPLIKPEALAALFQAMVFGLLVSWMVDPEDVPLPALFADVRHAWYSLLGCEDKL